MTDNENQTKSDQDPAEWMPPLTSVYCRYIEEWAAVKTRWGPTVDSTEKSALTSYAASCTDSAANVQATYTVNLSGEAAAGAWSLRAQDVYKEDTGYLDTWTLTV